CWSHRVATRRSSGLRVGVRGIAAGADQADAHVGAAHVGRDERRVGAAHGVHWRWAGDCGHVVSGRTPPAPDTAAAGWPGVWKCADNDVNTRSQMLLPTAGSGDRNDVDCIRSFPLNTNAW